MFFVCYWSIFFYTTKIGYASFSSFGWTNCHLTEFSYYFHTINFDQEAFVSLYYNDTWKAVGGQCIKNHSLSNKDANNSLKLSHFAELASSSSQLNTLSELCWKLLVLACCSTAGCWLRGVVIELSSSSSSREQCKCSAAMISWDYHATFELRILAILLKRYSVLMPKN